MSNQEDYPSADLARAKFAAGELANALRYIRDNTEENIIFAKANNTLKRLEKYSDVIGHTGDDDEDHPF